MLLEATYLEAQHGEAGRSSWWPPRQETLLTTLHDLLAGPGAPQLTGPVPADLPSLLLSLISSMQALTNRVAALEVRLP